MSATALLTDLQAAGFTEDVIRRARERLGVKPRKEGFGKAGVWVWELPTTKDGKDGSKDGKDGKENKTCRLSANEADKGIYSNDLPKDGKDLFLCHLSGPALPSSDSNLEREVYTI